jgi:uncharacterized membrane protein
MSKNKRDKVLKGNKKKGFRIELLIPVIIVIIGVILIMSFSSSDNDNLTFGNKFVSYKKVKANDGTIKLPVKQFDDFKAKYFQYQFKDKNVLFFAVKSSDGVIRAAFDSCDVCFREKKGYRQEGNIMVCNNCGQQFPTERINVEMGGCNPAPLNRKIEQGQLVLNVADVYTGAAFF